MVGYACLFIESLSAGRVGAYCIRPTKRYQRWRGMSRFHPLRGRLLGVCNTPLQSGTCDPSKYRCNFPTEYVLSFEKPPRFRPLRGRLWGVCNTPLQPGTYDPSKYRCNSPTGYVRSFEIPMQFSNRVCAILQKTVLFSSPSGPLVRRIQYAPTTGYVLPFKKMSRFRPLRGRLWGICDTPLQSGTCDPSKYRCDPLTGYVRGFKK